jgi:glucose dehydrogenase
LVEGGARIEFGRRMDLLRRFQTLGGQFVPYEHPGRDTYVDSSREAIGFGYDLERYRVKAVGGSTLHWGGRINRLMPSDFRTASTYGLGTDWPLSYAELEPYYSAAEWKIGVSGTPDPLLPARSREYSMPAFPFSVDEQRLLPIAERLGISSALGLGDGCHGGVRICR